MGHWYDGCGNPQHTVVGKNGRERDTTLADARKLKLRPSVTTILDIQSKPMLVQWLQNQLLDAAIENPFHPEEWQEENWRRFVVAKSKSIGEKAAKRGNELHDKLEDYFNGEGICKKDKKYITPAIELIHSEFGNVEWIAEKSFAHKDGFGGSVDLHSVSHNIIIDFKTKDKTDVKSMVQYDDHRIQLAAYQAGLQLPDYTRRFNLFISTNAETPGLCKLVECTAFDKYRDMFYTLLKLWQLRNNYVPE